MPCWRWCGRGAGRGSYVSVYLSMYVCMYLRVICGCACGRWRYTHIEMEVDSLVHIYIYGNVECAV